ncbi:MAG: trypsin-like peptidase domain-containing protein [Candidatus Ancillula trichonymphae]|jgi:putative serine protease PepD|nr:trypsin-like peptidase domain-containing protein [Candidatus Ancillula trichonymphae]
MTNETYGEFNRDGNRNGQDGGVDGGLPSAFAQGGSISGSTGGTSDGPGVVSQNAGETAKANVRDGAASGRLSSLDAFVASLKSDDAAKQTTASGYTSSVGTPGTASADFFSNAAAAPEENLQSTSLSERAQTQGAQNAEAPRTFESGFSATAAGTQEAPEGGRSPKTMNEKISSRRLATTGVLSALITCALVFLAANFGLIHFVQRGGSLADIGKVDQERLLNAAYKHDGSVPDWTKVVAAVGPSAVSIQASDKVTGSGALSLGSGIVYDKEGHIITNDHVVSEVKSASISVTMSDGRVYDATVVGTDPTSDLALIKLSSLPSDGLIPVKFGDSSALIVGEKVLSVGNPLRLSNTATEGMISALDRPVLATSFSGSSNNAPTITNAIQFDASVNPGNSGGPLFNANGELIGVTSSFATTSSSSGSIGLSFAIPSNLVKSVTTQLIEKGKAEHVQIGATLKDVTVEVNGTSRKAARVDSVISGSTAEKTGLQKGDVILEFNGKAVSSSFSLIGYIRAMPLNSKVKLKYIRNKNEVNEIEVTLDQVKEEPVPTTDEDDSDSSGKGGIIDPWKLFGEK